MVVGLSFFSSYFAILVFVPRLIVKDGSPHIHTPASGKSESKKKGRERGGESSLFSWGTRQKLHKLLLFPSHEQNLVMLSWLQRRLEMCPAKSSVNLERDNRCAGKTGGTAAASVIETCKAHSIRLLEASLKKKKKWFPITNTKIRKLKDITKKVKAYYYIHILNSYFIAFQKTIN